VRTVCLVGNGTSIAYNSELAVGELTRALRASFESSDTLELQELASALVEAEDDQGFEDLLGPFDVIAGMLSGMPGANHLKGTLGESITKTKSNFERIYRAGVGLTLAHIADKSNGNAEAFQKKTLVFIQKLIDTMGPEPSTLCLATLNYDGQLMAGLNDLAKSKYCDMGGRQTDNIKPAEGFPELVCRKLRSENDFPVSRRIRFLQLHGSLGWLEDTQSSATFSVSKFNIPELRREPPCSSFWKLYANNPSVNWRPVVVLTNSKAHAIKRWPFSFAYNAFLGDLRRADRILVVGYGLGDAPLNARIRHFLPSPLPERSKFLILGRGDHEELEERAENAFGISKEKFTANVDGIPEAFASTDWAAWSA